MTTQTFSRGFPDSSTMYPSSRQSPGSGVGLERGAGGGLTWIEAESPTKSFGRGAAVPTGVDRARCGVAEGSSVGTGVGEGFATPPVPLCEIRSEEHTSELQSRGHLVCRLLLEKKKKKH